MKLALLHYTSSPVVGGVERILADHARLFAAEGHEVTLLSGEGGADHPLPELRRATPCEDLEKTAADLRALLRPLLARQEIVFLHNVCTMPFHPALTMALWDLAEELAGTPTRFICWVHDLAAAQPEYPLPATPARPWQLLRTASPHFEYVAVSDWRREQLETHLALPSGRCRVIPNGLSPWDHWGFSSALTRTLLALDPHLLRRELLLLQPARLVRRKNIAGSLHILAALRAAGCDATLLVTAAADPHQAASAAYRTEMQALRASLGLTPHAHFLGETHPLEAAEVTSLYRLADALLFPSLQEGFGLPPLEAALQRLPFFAPRLPPLVATFGVYPGLYPPDFTPEDIAGLIIREGAASPSIQARRRVLSAHTWPALYRNFIAPLLASPHTIPGPYLPT